MKNSTKHFGSSGQHLIWIGPRYSDIEYTNGLFSGSVTLFGPDTPNSISYCNEQRRRVNHNITVDDHDRFFNENMLKAIELDNDVMFMSYNPNHVFSYDDEVIKRTVCLNDKPVMDMLDQKTQFRSWASKHARSHQSLVMRGEECSFEDFRTRFGGGRSFVVQKDCAPGGEGSFLVDARSGSKGLAEIGKTERVLVSPYVRNNIPLNIHAVIFEDETILLPCSVQIIGPGEGKFLYRGADYVAAQALPQSYKREFNEGTLSLCAELRRLGYRGLVGFDAMAYDGHVHFLECNNRFQGSTMALNRALCENGLPSIQEMNLRSFNEESLAVSCEGLAVGYSCYSYEADAHGKLPRIPRNLEGNPHFVGEQDDAFNLSFDVEPRAYIKRVLFDTNITSVTREGSIALHPNIQEGQDDWYEGIVREHDAVRLKIALTNQGVSIERDAWNLLEKQGGLRAGVHFAVDITFPDYEGLIVNAPLGVRFADISPFSIVDDDGLLGLRYYDSNPMRIETMPQDQLGGAQTSSGVAMRNICLIATDRVRVQHSRFCKFKAAGVGCSFCEVDDRAEPFGMDDIREAIDMYLESSHRFRHFLIGGRSSASSESEITLEIARYINERCGYPVYLMVVPPEDLSVLPLYKKAGVTEVSFNIELWDREIARELMPGKGAIPLSRYLEALGEAVRLWGSKGAVRSCLIVGLERDESLMEGISTLCEMGVAPMLSVFRPIPGTPCENIVPPSNDYLLDLYYRAQGVCAKHGLRLGPECSACQNNTLSMPGSFVSDDSWNE